MSIFDISLEWQDGLLQVLIYAGIALAILKLLTKIGEDDDR